MRARLIAAMFVCIGMLAVPSVNAWSNGGYSADPNNPDRGTHDWIALRAVEMQTRNATFLETTFKAKFLLGTEAPDNPDYIGDTSKHHVYFYSDAQMQDDASAVRAGALYSAALGYLKAGNYELAAYDIGVMAHYISDVGVFGHTMGAYTDWGSEAHHSDYETGFEDRLDSLPQPTGITLLDMSAYDATLGLARTITFGAGLVQSNTWMDDNYDWANATFYASALASLNEAVEAVASAVNHLLIEANATVPTPDPTPTPTHSPPQPPATVTADVQDSEIHIEWTASPDDGGAEITGYAIYVGTDPDAPIFVATVGPTVDEWTHWGAVEGVTYYYWVAAVNIAGEGAMSLKASAMLPEPEEPSHSYVLPIVLSAASASIAVLGALLWRRRSRRV